jgi:phage-related protein
MLPAMEFSVDYYETASGKCPVREFLLELKATDPNDYAAVMAGLDKLRQRQNHREPLSKPIGKPLFELRHLGKLNTRIIYFFRKGRRIIAVHGIRNKDWKIPSRDIKIALSRMNDWLNRHPDEKN